VKVTESFVIDQPAPVLWEFFEQIDRVARCVPGVEDVEVLDDENSRLRIAQSIGPMTTTLDMRMQITERVPPSTLSFTATGRSVKGAVGHVRATNVIELSQEDEGSTRVSVAADIALGGMIGSVGQKAVAKQARKISQSFAAALQREIRGESAAATAREATVTQAAENGSAPAAAPAAAPTLNLSPNPVQPAAVAAATAPRTTIASHVAAALAGVVTGAALGVWLRRPRTR
jgi:uncharacterized protein